MPAGSVTGTTRPLDADGADTGARGPPAPAVVQSGRGHRQGHLALRAALAELGLRLAGPVQRGTTVDGRADRLGGEKLEKVLEVGVEPAVVRRLHRVVL